MSGFGWGLLTVSIDCELFYISKKYSMFKLFNQTKTTTKFLKITDLPRHLQIVYCNLSAGDLLVGMKIHDSNKNEITTVVARFHVINNMIANLLSTMLTPEHDMYPAIFRDPNYITENNDDILVSDYWRGVVVTNHKGKHRFTYRDTPFGSQLRPGGISTDAMSHIIVCDCNTKSVHILDKDCKFLLFIPSEISYSPYSKPSSLSHDWNPHILRVVSCNNTESRQRHISRQLALTGKSN